MTITRKFYAVLSVFTLMLCFAISSVADTIRLKDGSTLRGEIIGFRDQQFTVLLGSNTRGRRSRIMLYMEDVESVEFDSAANADTTAPASNNAPTTSATSSPAINTVPPSTNSTSTSQPTSTQPPRTTTTNPPASSTSSTTSPSFIQINVRVRGDNAANGWTNTGYVVRRGQRLRISATGRVSLGQNRNSTPSGLSTLPDRDKLMRDEPTGALVAVIGDDNDSFIVIGQRREFTAQRDGVLFLGINEGTLTDNTGAYDAVIEAETTR